jgi:hypothetical protein
MSSGDQIPQSAEEEHRLGLHRTSDDLCSLCAAAKADTALRTELEQARADRDVYKRVIDAITQYLKTDTIDESVQSMSTTFCAVVGVRVALGMAQTKIAELEHKLAVEKGRPGHDSYRDDLLKMMCAMVSSFEPSESFDPEKVVFVASIAVDKVYAEAAKRR